MKRIIFSLVIVLMLVMTALFAACACSLSPNLPPEVAQPAVWPTTWAVLSTDPDDGGGSDPHRDVLALYYAVDSDYIYLRMETVSSPGWPSTGSQGDARYKWWFDTAGTAAYVHGTTVEKAEFLLILEDLVDNSNDPNAPRDQLGELTLMDDLNNAGFMARWDSDHPPNYTKNNAQTVPIGPSSWWRRELGSDTAGVGGPQGVMGANIGYRIDNATTGGNFVDIYISWTALGNPSSLCLIWATDNQNPDLDQAPNLDRPEVETCLSVCVPPIADFHASDTSPCVNEEINFFDDSTGTYDSWSWDFGDGDTSNLQNPSHTYTNVGTYTISLTISNGCGDDTATRDNYITVDPLPEAAFHATPTSGCAPLTVVFTDLSAGSPTSWSWDFGDGDTSNTQNPSHIYTSAGTYTVSLTVSNACGSDTETKDNYITVYAKPTANAGGDTGFCAGGSVQLSGSATGGNSPYTYDWTGPENHPNTQNPTISTPGTYTLTVTDGKGCTDTDDVIVSQYPSPTANAGGDTEFCAGGSVQLSGSATGGNSPYTYDWTGPENHPNTQNPTISTPGTYTLTVSDGKGCTDTDDVIVSQYPSPTANAGGDTEFCAGGSVQLSGSATGGNSPYTYDWTGPENHPNTQNPTVSTPGTYTLTVTDDKGCTVTDDVIVSQYPSPTANAGVDKEICAGGSVCIGGSPTGSGGTGALTYSWSPTSGLDDATASNPTASPSSTTTYTVEVTDSKGCTDTDSMTVTVLDGPTADAGGDTGFCAGGSVQLNGSATGGNSPYAYDWTGPENHPNTQNPTVSKTGTYNLKVTDDKGCTDTDEVIVSQYPSPTADAGGDEEICAGGSIVIGGSPTGSGGTGALTYSWSPTSGLDDATASNPTASPSSTTTYTVEVTDSKGCTDTDSMTVTVNPRPTADAGGDEEICAGDSVGIGGSPTGSGGTGALTYSWSPTSGLDDATASNPTASPGSTTTYTVTVTDSNGCTDADDVTVTVSQCWCICGFVYRAGTMEVLAGWEVILEKKTSPWHEVQRTFTDADGKYCFCGLGNGEYRTSEVVKPGWYQVSPVPNEHLVTLSRDASDPEDGPFLNFENDQSPNGPNNPNNPGDPLTVGWEASPIDKLAVLAPWIALFAAIAASASLLVVRRRRSQS